MVKKTHRLRVLLVAFMSGMIFLTLEARLYYVQVHRHEDYVSRASGQQFLVEELRPKRGDILDRDSQPLATSTTFHAVYFNPPPPPKVSEKEAPVKVPAWRKRLTPDFVHDLAAVLNLTEPRVEQVLASSGYTRLKDMAPPEMGQMMRMLMKEHGIARDRFTLEDQSKRLYPRDELAAPVVGLAGIDPYGQNIGLEGLEFHYNETLRGELTSQRLQRTLNHGELEALDDTTLRRSFGDSLVLTLDSQIQHAAREALLAEMARTEAESGVVLVMDVKTGEMLAMVSLPDFNPNRVDREAAKNLRNRALTDPIEIGSVMKILTTAILLDNNLLDVDEPVDCHNGYAVIDGRVFRDSHAQGIVPFRLAFAESSNIAMATVGLRLEPALYYESLRRFGLGGLVGIDLPGEDTGVLRPVNQWSKLSRTSLPVGYETSLTALQVITAVGAIGNKGIRMRPYVVKRIESIEGRVLEEIPPRPEARVAREETCESLLELMRTVVEEGTGTRARVEGYTVAGKTGTTRKHTPDRRYIASFAGLIPGTDPRLAIYCFVNEPNPEIAFYGGSIAAPVFAKVAAEAVRILGIPPDRPTGGETGIAADREDGAEGEALMVADSGRPEVASGLESEPATDLDLTVFGAEPSDDATGEFSEPAFPSDTPAGKGDAMPYCLGLTMAEVLERTADAKFEIKMVGSGIAVRQSPPPGTPMPPGRQALVVFAVPSQVMTNGRTSAADNARTGIPAT